MRAVVQATLTLLTKRAFSGLKTDNIFFSDKDKDRLFLDDDQDASSFTISKPVFMDYVSKIQRENHHLTCLKNDSETNSHLRYSKKNIVIT